MPYFLPERAAAFIITWSDVGGNACAELPARGAAAPSVHITDHHAPRHVQKKNVRTPVRRSMSIPAAAFTDDDDAGTEPSSSAPNSSSPHTKVFPSL